MTEFAPRQWKKSSMLHPLPAFRNEEPSESDIDSGVDINELDEDDLAPISYFFDFEVRKAFVKVARGAQLPACLYKANVCLMAVAYWGTTPESSRSATS